MSSTEGLLPVVNVTRVIDEGRVTGTQVAAIALCAAVAFLDGVDTQSMALVAPMILAKLQLAISAYGSIISAAHLGAMVGALTFGLLADRFGRKTMLVLAAATFGAFTLATALAESYPVLLALRFCAGIGLGGATPCFIALATEFAPARRRAAVASLIWSAFPLGGTIGGFASAWILGRFSWQAVFAVGGVLPLVVAAALLAWLPESIRFLLARDGSPEQVSAILERIRPGLPRPGRFVADEQHASGAPLRALFARGVLPTTLVMWVPFMAAFGVLTVTVSWTPLLLRQHGFAPSLTAVVIGFHGLGALVGMSSAGRLMERFGAVTVLVPALILGAVCTATLGAAAYSVTAMSVVLILIGLFVGMGASGSIALASLTYPTALRSSGVGWAMGMGRFAQVLFPLAVSYALGAGLGETGLFPALAAAPVLGALAILFLRKQGIQARQRGMNAVSAAPPVFRY